MDSDYAESSEGEPVPSTSKDSKKRKRIGRVTDVMKKLRASTHELGPDCFCKRFKCFSTISAPERHRLIREFNDLGETNSQNSFLAGLITVLPVMRRRPRKNEEEARTNSASFSYRVRICEDGKINDVPVCVKAFASLHGITQRRVRYVRESLAAHGKAPIDMRGKHDVRPHKLSDETKQMVKDFILSLKSRKSHYSLKDSRKLYLSDSLNITKLHNMYNEKNPDHKMQYESFRCIFENDFNISFGYPRKDTCSTCDTLKAELSVLSDQSVSCEDEAIKMKALLDLKVKLREKELHLRKSERFYQLKRSSRKQSMKSNNMESITMDFLKNLPTPNITTNDVYYKRQLNFITFNVHKLSDSHSVFYTYDESVAKKGADDVCSMMYHFFKNVLPVQVRHLAIFCDSCAGQNKNYTVFRLLHYMVVHEKRFDVVKVIFPIRGHSYLECDRNMSLINQKTYTETPEDWREEFRNCRVKPHPFEVIDCGDDFNFHNWTAYLSSLYPAKCPFPTRPIRMVKFEAEHPTKIFHKNTFSGNYQQSSMVIKKILKTRKGAKKRNNANTMTLEKLYTTRLPIKKAKWDDLQHLTAFLERTEAKEFYQKLTFVNQPEGDEDDFVDDPVIDG